jgi:hypothetical protein
MRLNKWTHEIPIARVHHLIDIRAQTAVIINELKSLKRQKTTHLAGHGFQRLSATNHFSTLQHISAHEPLLRSFTKPIVLKHLHYYFSCCSLFFCRCRMYSTSEPHPQRRYIHLPGHAHRVSQSSQAYPAQVAADRPPALFTNSLTSHQARPRLSYPPRPRRLFVSLARR